MVLFLSLVHVFLLLISGTTASARLSDGRPHANMIRPAAWPSIPASTVNTTTLSRNGTLLPPLDTVYYFDQLIDHNNPSLGTFKQRYWHTYQNYEPGGPIILSTPGEGNADGYWQYLGDKGIHGLIAKQQNGSVIIIEHRFYGFSNPYPDLSVRSLRVHTIQQAIDDLEYFAKNVNLPMPNGDSLGPDKAPWILVGGSYSGALTSWTMVNKPSVFAAGYASSAVVEAIIDFWQYFEPIRQNMPANCSADVQAVISHIDRIFQGTNATQIQQIKDILGIGAVNHLDDVAGALRNNLWDWQALSPTVGPGAEFFNFCDALEVKGGEIAPASGWGAEHALLAWGNYWKTHYYELLCGDTEAEECLGTYDTTQDYWTNTDVDNWARSWMWIVCNEVGYLQDAAPLTKPTLVSRLVQPNYDFRQCQQMFPTAFPMPPIIKANNINTKYKGWDVKLNNIFFANGIRDPWKDTTLSAEGIHVKSTPSQPIGLSNGFHCSDMKVASGEADPTVGAVQAQALASMRRWLSAWKPSGNHTHSTKPRGVPIPLQASHNAPSKPVNAWLRNFGSRMSDCDPRMSQICDILGVVYRQGAVTVANSPWDKLTTAVAMKPC